MYTLDDFHQALTAPLELSSKVLGSSYYGIPVALCTD